MDTLGFILHLSWVTLEYEEDKVNISQTPSIYLPGDVHVFFFFYYKVKTEGGYQRERNTKSAFLKVIYNEGKSLRINYFCTYRSQRLYRPSLSNTFHQTILSADQNKRSKSIPPTIVWYHIYILFLSVSHHLQIPEWKTQRGFGERDWLFLSRIESVEESTDGHILLLIISDLVTVCSSTYRE